MKHIDSRAAATPVHLFLGLIFCALLALNVSAQDTNWSISLRDTAGNDLDPANWIHDPEVKLLVQGTPFDATHIDIDEDPDFSNPTTWDFINPYGSTLLQTCEAPMQYDMLRQVAFHPDGKTLAAVGTNGKIFIWNSETGQKTDEFLAFQNNNYPTDMAFVCGGSKIMAWSTLYRGIYLYDYPLVGAPSHYQYSTLPTSGGDIYDVIPSPDDTKVLVSHYIDDPDNPDQKKTVIKLYDIETGEILQTYDECKYDLSDPIYTMSFNGEGTQFITVSDRVRLWDVASGRIIKYFSTAFSRYYPLDFSPDGKSILRSGEDVYGKPYVKIFDIATEEVIQTFEVQTYTPFKARFSPDGMEVLTVSPDQNTRLWDTRTGQLLETCEGNVYSYRDAIFSPDGSKFATASYDSTAKVWRGRPKYDYSIQNTADGSHTLYVRLRDDQGHSETISYDFNLNLAPADANWTMKLADPEGDIRLEGNWINRTQMQAVLEGASVDAEEVDISLEPSFENVVPGSLSEIRFTGGTYYSYPLWDDPAVVSSDWKKIASTHSYSVVVCDFAGNWEIFDTTISEAYPRKVLFNPDGTRLFVALQDGSSRLLDGDTGDVIDDDYLKIFHIGNVYGEVAWSPDGTKILYAVDGHDMKLADAQTKEVLHTLSGHTGRILGMDFNADGTMALTCGEDARIILWDLQTGDIIRSTKMDPFSIVQSVAFSPDGTQYLSAGDDTYAHLWDTQTGEEIHSFGPHAMSVMQVLFSHDGTKVFTYSAGYIRAWNAENGQSLDGYSFMPSSNIALSPDGSRMFNVRSNIYNSFQRYAFSLEDLPDGPYLLHVRLRNHLGLNQINSLAVNLDTIAPAKPGMPYVSSDPVPGGQLGFVWSPSTDNISGVASYDFQVGTAPGGIDVIDGRINAGDPLIISAPRGLPVYCRVRAIDKAGNVSEWSEPSAPAFVTTEPTLTGVALDPPYPRAIDDVTARPTALPYPRYRIEWDRQSTNKYELMFTGPQLSSDFLTKGDVWRCKIYMQIPDGNFKYLYTKDFTVRNTPPSQPIVALSPRPAVAGQPLAVTLVQPSIDPDEDPIAYDIQWRQSTDGGQTWTTREDLAGLSEIPGSEINGGDRWQVRYLPYESDSPTGPDRAEGLPGQDQVVVGANQPPQFSFTNFQLINVLNGVALGTQWTANDPEGQAVSIDLYYFNEEYSMLTPLQMGIPAGQGSFGTVLPLPHDAPLKLFAVVSDAGGSVTQVTSEAFTLQSAANSGWVLYQ